MLKEKYPKEFMAIRHKYDLLPNIIIFIFFATEIQLVVQFDVSFH